MTTIVKHQRHWFAPEIVQTSAMDCGPASLKCLLEGFRIPVSYGRLREACQTSVDGTSIDQLETVALQLGLAAEQVMLPFDYLLLPAADALPAMVVCKQADGSTHFVVVWRRIGAWVQVMDPATGRRWVRGKALLGELFRHAHTVPSVGWRDWAGSEAFLLPLRARITALGVDTALGNALVDEALVDHEWYGVARLDAATRLVTSLIEADGVPRGKQAQQLLCSLFRYIDKRDIYGQIPLPYWSVVPQRSSADGDKQLTLHGVVMLQVRNAKPLESAAALQDLPRELAAALHEKPAHSLRALLALLRRDGLLTPLALLLAISVSAAAVLLESLLFRGIFDIAWELRTPQQRLLALLSLFGFTALLLTLDVPIVQQAMRMGRHLETRFRMALLDKLPRLHDRYFQSRPISDMAERGHSIAVTRAIPNLAVQLSQTVWDMVFTLVGIALLDVKSALWALGIAALAMLLPWLAQPLLNERDLRVRSHAGALFGFYLDALLGLVPIRAHSAEAAVRREHEALLTEWTRAGRSFIRLSMVTEGAQALCSVLLVCALLYQHFQRTGGIVGSDLLLVFWALKLPAIGTRLTSIAQQYPAQRNSMLRLLEPLVAPEEVLATKAVPDIAAAPLKAAVEIELTSVDVVAGGHALLRNISLEIKPGEHVAIVGPSGAGKSTLLGLLLGWHQTQAGHVAVNGAELAGPYLQRLRQHTAWVDPGIQVWNRTLLDNLGFSTSSVDGDDLSQVLDAADLRGLLEKLPQGLQTYLGEGGGLLSGGEGQRVRLARALLQRDVKLVLLDEPFRGMDRQQRQHLLREIRQWWCQATLLCVTHDLEETLQFERVLVIDNGELVEDAAPDALQGFASRYDELLMAERRVHLQQWLGTHWRRWWLQDGRVQETVP